ncbi:MAG: winged helix DNA-binding domain-containing protein [Acidobacteria bacterium]|nr:winged helix DNA-binding domain-containing protein [Acidobacteriota bacterium]
MGLDTIDVLTTSLGVYGTAPMSYLSLLARDAIATTSGLDRALDEERTVASIRAMRYSVHIFPLELLPVMAAATRKNNHAAVANRAKKLGDRLETISPRVLDALADGPLTANEIKLSPTRVM